MSDTFQIVSPVDGTVYAERRDVARDNALTAADRGAAAQRRWRGTSLEQRLALLTDAVDRVVAESDDIALELAHSMGRPIDQGGGEVGGFEERARYMMRVAPQALAEIVPDAIKGFRRFIRREPLGVVLTIAPWNYPYMTAVNSVWPALAAGNAVLLKHARQTTLAAERIQRVLAAAGLPEGVLQAVPMSHDATAAVMQAEAVRMVCFTGSVRGGREVQRAIGAGEGFTGAGLELGGKDPGYVRADADLAQAAAGIADGAFSNGGQSCCSIERVYVHDSVYHDFIAGLLEEARALRLGNPLDRGTTLGPLVKPEAAEFVRGQIADAVAAGAHTLLDTAEWPADGGAYMAPQIVIDVDHSMRLMTEESFGPVVGVMRVGSDTEAVELMNDSEFGLTAALWTADPEAATALGDQLETGTVYMNRCDYLDPALAWAGVKHTGRGCTLSTVGYEQLTRPKSFHLRTHNQEDE